MKHLTTNDLIPHQHHGGVPGNNTMTALISLIAKWTENMENGVDMVGLAMDQSMAYDVVHHTILSKKLAMLGLDIHSLQLMNSYMNQRFQSERDYKGIFLGFFQY